MSLFVFVEYDIISKMWATWKESDKLSEIGQIIRNGTNIVGLNKVENITICCLFLFFFWNISQPPSGWVQKNEYKVCTILIYYGLYINYSYCLYSIQYTVYSVCIWCHSTLFALQAIYVTLISSINLAKGTTLSIFWCFLFGFFDFLTHCD